MTDELRFPLDLNVPIDEEALAAAIAERMKLANKLENQSNRLNQEAAALQQLQAALEWLARLAPTDEDLSVTMSP